MIKGGLGHAMDAAIFNDPEAGDFPLNVDWEGIMIEHSGFTGNASVYYDSPNDERVDSFHSEGQAGSAAVIRKSNYSKNTFTQNGTAAAVMNRNTNAGRTLEFHKDSVRLGAIEIESDDGVSLANNDGEYCAKINVDGSTELGNGEIKIVTIVSGSANPRIIPLTDNTYDLGATANRFVDVWATNGTIQTSDETLKDFAEISEAETRVSIAAKSLLKKYKWKTGGGWHFGLGAQSLAQAFTDEELDWKDYDVIRFSDNRYSVSYSDLLAFIILSI